MAPNDLQVVRNIKRQDHPLFKYVTTAPRIAREARRGGIPRGHSDHTTVSYVRKHRSLRTADASNNDAPPKQSAAGQQATATFQQMMANMEVLATAKTPDEQRSAISKINEDADNYCILMNSYWNENDIKDFKKQVANKIANKIKENVINNEMTTYKDEFTKTTSRPRLLVLIPQIYGKFSAYISVKWPDTAASSKEIRAAIKSLTDELGNKLTANGKWESGAFEKYFTVLMQASTKLLKNYPEPETTNQSAQK